MLMRFGAIFSSFGRPSWPGVLAFGAFLSSLAAWPAAAAPVETVAIQGSSTFTSALIEPYRDAIERTSGRRLDVIASRSIHGLTALLQGRTKLAMISMPLASELEALRKQHPELPVGRLQAFAVGRVRVAFIVHASNPVRAMASAELRRVLLGEIGNWQLLGGRDEPITVVSVKPGGGVPETVRRELLDGRQITARSRIEVEAPRHVNQVTGQIEGALGLTQLGLARRARSPQVICEQAIEQELSYVTLGDPDEASRAVIEATRAAAAGQLE